MLRPYDRGYSSNTQTAREQPSRPFPGDRLACSFTAPQAIPHGAQETPLCTSRDRGLLFAGFTEPLKRYGYLVPLLIARRRNRRPQGRHPQHESRLPQSRRQRLDSCATAWHLRPIVLWSRRSDFALAPAGPASAALMASSFTPDPRWTSPTDWMSPQPVERSSRRASAELCGHFE
jgi:hypothetical protein